MITGVAILINLNTESICARQKLVVEFVKTVVTGSNLAHELSKHWHKLAKTLGDFSQVGLHAQVANAVGGLVEEVHLHLSTRSYLAHLFLSVRHAARDVVQA
jgi:hypothetical protein